MLEFINRILHGRISSKIVTPIEIGRFGEYRHGEIDLVAWDNDVLVFIEVRTRRKVLSSPAFIR